MLPRQGHPGVTGLSPPPRLPATFFCAEISLAAGVGHRDKKAERTWPGHLAMNICLFGLAVVAALWGVQLGTEPSTCQRLRAGCFQLKRQGLCVRGCHRPHRNSGGFAHFRSQSRARLAHPPERPKAPASGPASRRRSSWLRVRMTRRCLQGTAPAARGSGGLSL